MANRNPIDKGNIDAIGKMDENDLRKNFYYKLGWFFGEDPNIKGGIMSLKYSIDKLIKTIRDANNSSEKLSKSIRNLTIYGTIIAAIALLLEFIKYCFPR
jgi:hypothetical protein